ncbi:MAG: hypothetical protein J6N50_09600, partial [Bacteroidales bacterium]|nr:hypothetical protein [Bacteroidales bacterium]
MLSVRDIAFNETGVRAVFPAAAQACHELYWQTVFALRGLSGRIHRPQSFAHAYAVCVVADGGEEGLDTLLASLAGQSIGFVEHIRVVVAGPEAPLAKVWKDRYPTNVILLPETEDRNAALRACLELKGIAWMAFARSGESFHRDCFRSLDRFIHSPAGKGVVLAVGATALQRGGRLTFRRMRGTPRSMPLHTLTEEISGDAAFFSAEAIRQSGATFEANCGCLMELFSGAFLLGQDNSANVGFVPGALRLCPEHNGLPCRPET